MANDEKALKKLAQARVVISKDLLSPETVTTSTTVQARKKASDFSVASKEDKKTLETLYIEEQINDLELLLKEIKVAERMYNKVEEENANAYNVTFQDLVKTAYENATKSTTTDPVTNKQLVTYENLEMPDFTYVPADSMNYIITNYDGQFLGKLVSDGFNKKLFSNFAELKEYLTQGLEKLSVELGSRTNFSNKSVSTGGVVLPINNGSALRTENTFTLSSTVSPLNKKLIILFNGMEPQTSIETGEFTITFAGGTPFVGTFTGDDQMTNGQLVVKVPLVNDDQTVMQDGIFNLSGKFISGLGRELFFDGTGLVTPLTTGPGSGSGSGHGLDFSIAPDNNFMNYREIGFNEDYNVIGNGNYRYEDKVVVTGTLGNGGNTDGGAIVVTNPSNGNTTVTTTTNQTVIQYIPSGNGIKRLGIADYRKVEQEVCCYVPGEVSHIENVMAREYKEKSTRRLRRQENTTTISKEKENEKLSDTTSTDRFEMNQEVNSVIAQQNALGVNASVHYDMGTGSYLNAGADFAHNTSQEESDHQAVTSAQEITERALERVVQKVKEERITKVIEEFEENNKHGYDNRKGDKHISGVYRWIDKIFRNRVVNYGKRLMYEFMIPEPASFHTVAAGSNLNLEIVEKPIDPRTIGFANPRTLNASNYLTLATAYGAQVDCFPLPIQQSFSKHDDQWGDDGRFGRVTEYKFEIPDGYKIDRIKGNVKLGRHAAGGPGSHPGGSIQIGTKFPFPAFGNTDRYDIDFTFSTEEITKELTMRTLTWDIGIFSYDMLGSFSASAITLEKWQIETFNTIIAAYELKLEQYNNKMDQLKTQRIEKTRTNPLFYRQIENNVLRKNCIDYLISNAALGKSMLNGSTILDIRAKYDEAILETYSAKVKFFEQAFEWDLMSYYFYPFYWAEKAKWKDLYNVDEMDDAIFRSFLQSGMARVILTVRPGFEEAVNWYMATGQIWNGGQVPTIDDPLFISIIEELRETEGEVEETWESRVPTSLTVIQAGNIGLNVQGLPCDDDCSDYKMFDSDGEQLFNPDGTAMSSNPLVQQPSEVLLGNITEDLETVAESIEEIKADIEEIKETLETNGGA